MEYMQGGSLTDVIERNLHLMTEARIAYVVRAVLSGMYMVMNV